MKQILDKIKSNKKILIPIISIALLLVLITGVSLAVFNYSNDNAGNNDINSGHISMTYTEPSNEYVVENALPVKDDEGVNSANYFEFSVTTTAPTNDTDDNGVSIPYEITITESEDNTLTSEQIKMYLTEVEGEKEVVNTSPTLVSNLEDSIYKNEGTKVGFNLHLHRNGNETITTKYRLRAWVDYNVDVSDWDTAGKYEYKFKVNVNGEATYQGYETDLSCFAYKKNANENYSITGYDFSKCDSKNIVVPTSVPEEIASKEILALNWVDDATFLEIYKNMMISDGFCEGYTEETGKEDWAGCLEYNETTEDGFNQEALAMYAGIKSQYNTYIGQNYYDYEEDLSEPIELGILTIDLSPEKTIVNYVKIDTITSFANTTVTAVSNDKDVYSVNNLNNVVENTEATASTIANETPIINGLIVPEGIEITNDAFSTIEINQLIDRKGEFPSSCFVYTSSSNSITITDYKCQGVKNLRVSSIIDGMSVTNISVNAFQNNQLASVTIPDSITTIGESAFANNQLISVTIPDSVTTIGGAAFANNQLTSVEIPDSVTYLSGFYNNKLTSIKIPDGVTYIGSSAFANNKLTSVDIPDSVTTIGGSAFANNQLTSVDIPDSVTEIGNYSFQNNKLTTVTIGNGVTTIGGAAFNNNKLTSVVIPDSVTYIEFSAFENNSLKYVKMQDNVTLAIDVFKNNKISKIENDNGYTPASCYKYTANDSYATITDFICPTSTVNIIQTINKLPITTIGDSAFANNKLTSVTIPDSVTTIGGSAFENNQLTSVTIPDSVTTIGGSAFANNQLIKAIIGNGVTSIGNYAFFGNQLTSVDIPDNVTTIGHEAFVNNQLIKAIIGNGVTSIGNRAFYKDFTSNPNLTRIVNTTGRSFNWYSITTLTDGIDSFVTGTIKYEAGNVDIVAK